MAPGPCTEADTEPIPGTGGEEECNRLTYHTTIIAFRTEADTEPSYAGTGEKEERERARERGGVQQS